MLAKKYLPSLRPRLVTSRRGKASQGLSTRKHQGNQLQHPSRRSHRLLERHRLRTNRLVLLCRSPRLLKHLRPPIELGDNSPAIALLWLDFHGGNSASNAFASFKSRRQCVTAQDRCCTMRAADLIAFSSFYRSNHHPIRNFGV